MVNNDGKNACRNIHALVKRTHGLAIPLSIDVCSIWVKQRKPVRVERTTWPIIKLESWLDYMLGHQAELLLGGHCLGDLGWRAMFARFWQLYQHVDATHRVFQDFTEAELSTCIPFMIHGDEGRGLVRRPYMVVSTQPVVGHKGLHFTNESAPTS